MINFYYLVTIFSRMCGVEDVAVAAFATHQEADDFLQLAKEKMFRSCKGYLTEDQVNIETWEVQGSEETLKITSKDPTFNFCIKLELRPANYSNFITSK